MGDDAGKNVRIFAAICKKASDCNLLSTTIGTFERVSLVNASRQVMTPIRLITLTMVSKTVAAKHPDHAVISQAITVA
jgi:hypothetical protein